MTRRRGWICGALLASGLGIWIRCGPLPPGLLLASRRTSTLVTDRAGVILSEAPSSLGDRTRLVDAARLPRALVEATLSAEDRRFFSHPGVDPLALLRAAIDDVRAGRIVEGGSTVTEQVVKQLNPRPRSALSKLREIFFALRLEHRFSKREILALYLNVAPYGNRIAGAAEASRRYFGCAPENLTPAEAAFLAGLPQRPSGFDPYRNFAAARERQNDVLDRMARDGFVTAEELRRARAERLVLVRGREPVLAPHFVRHVLAGFAVPPRRIETTLDSELQRRIDGIISAARPDLRRHGASNVAVAVLDNRSAGWLAWEGSGNFGDEAHGGQIDGVLAPRQPGSALKPFTYALAFEQGWTPASVLPDVPSHFETADPGVLYTPRNYDGIFRGPLRARDALAGSENVPAVWLLSRLGVAPLERMLRRAGLTTLDRSPDYYGVALTMGDAEVRLADLVAAYSAIARGGLAIRPHAIQKIEDTDGGMRSPEAGRPERILSHRAAAWVADILADGEARSFIFGRGGSLEFPFEVAVKTGTSQAYHDNWTVGFTRDITVGVWVGNFDRTPLIGSSGVSGAGPIFHSVMLAAERRVRGGDPPASESVVEPEPGLRRVSICALSGMSATDRCPRRRIEMLPEAMIPNPCDWHNVRTVVYPNEFRSWAVSRGLTHDAARASSAASPLHVAAIAIENPPAGAVYLYDHTLRAEFQDLPLRARVRGAVTRLSWTIDGTSVGEAWSDAAIDWPLHRGRHVILVSDPEGRTASTEIVVRD